MADAVERRDFLVEIGTEELPPKALARLAAAFESGIAGGLEAAGLVPERTARYFSPRRLAVKVAGLPVKQSDQVQERLGPAVQAAFDADGKPTKAAEGFAGSVGATVEQLARKATDKGERLAYTLRIEGRAAPELLPGIVQDALGKLPIPKRMRWGAGEVEFIRPVHWVVMLLGADVVPGEILGIPAGRETRGHRFHAPEPIVLDSPADYPARLAEPGHVQVNDADNSLAEGIRAAVVREAEALGGEALGIGADSELLDEVAALNEWPVPVVGSIPERFLELPEEVLITTIESHQRYFPVRGKDGRLLPSFVTFANIASRDPAIVRTGNERVVVPRLEDAMFFWNTDRKRPLADRVAELDSVTFQKKLGSIGDKVRRVTALAERIAGSLETDTAQARRAATLAKADLVTDMVFEFTELQGVMGRYYALHDGEPAEVAEAIFEQYLPRFAGDTLPKTGAGRCLAIADKLDTVSGIFAIGQKPSGSKDPFALRRAALGLLRIVIECGLELDLRELIRDALAAQPVDAGEDTGDEVYGFFMDRLQAYYRDRGVRADVIDAVLAESPAQPLDFDARVQAVNAFLELPEATALAAANKRIGNILRKSENEGTGDVDERLLESGAEQGLYEELLNLETETTPLLEMRDYTAALKELASLREPVDAYFDAVMVMSDDPKLRDNRLSLLGRLQALMGEVADLARIQVDA